eukprot:3727399-Rhodomonas_salina.3
MASIPLTLSLTSQGLILQEPGQSTVQCGLPSCSSTRMLARAWTGASMHSSVSSRPKLDRSHHRLFPQLRGPLAPRAPRLLP